MIESSADCASFLARSRIVKDAAASGNVLCRPGKEETASVHNASEYNMNGEDALARS